MTFSHIGSAFGREIFVTGPSAAQADTAQPQGYSIAAILLEDGWKSEELGSLLNQLYGGIEDWTAFDPNGGARSFVFYGDRAEEASDLCDAFAYAWTRGADDEYNGVIACSNNAADVPRFVEAVLSGEVVIGDRYVDRVRNVLFAVRRTADADAVSNAVQQHRFD